MFDAHRQVTTGRGDQPFSLIVDTGSSNTWVGVNGGYPLKDVPDDDQQGNVVSKVPQACGAYLTVSTHDTCRKYITAQVHSKVRFSLAGGFAYCLS